MRNQRVLALALVMLAGLLAEPALAHRQGVLTAPESPARTEARAHGGMSLDAAVQMVQQRYKARVVRAETRQENGRTVYVLRLLNADGKVWTVRVDADSGEVL